MKFASIVTFFVAFSGIGLGAASKAKSTYSFATGKSADGQQPTHKKTIRQRRAAEISSAKLVQPTSSTGKEHPLTNEDVEFWNRMLQSDMGSVAPTPPPTVGPCPVRVEVECISTDGSETPCVELQPPASGEGDNCIVEVEFRYIITNNGNDDQRIYSVEVMRGGETIEVTDVPDVLPDVDLAPGETVVAVMIHEFDICTAEGVGVFDTQVDVLAGPPCDVEVAIACVSEEGEECRSISQPETTENCLLDVTYSYTVDNTGLVDANIIFFSREREGEIRDLMPLLDTTFIEVGGQTQVQETEEIDRCIAQVFTTNTIVEQRPNPELLCEDTGFYP